jgi:hypothetical protein
MRDLGFEVPPLVPSTIRGALLHSARKLGHMVGRQSQTGWRSGPLVVEEVLQSQLSDLDLAVKGFPVDTQMEEMLDEDSVKARMLMAETMTTV